MANGLEMLIQANPNLSQNQQIARQLATSLNQYFKDMKIDLNTNDAIKKINVLKTEFDTLHKRIQSFEIDLGTATGATQKVRARVSYNEAGDVTGTKITNASSMSSNVKLANQYMTLTNKIANNLNKLNKLKINNNGTEENIRAMERLKAEIISVSKERQNLKYQMEQSGMDTSSVNSHARETMNGVANNRASMVDANAGVQRNNTLREYNKIQQQTLSLQRVLASEETKATSNFTANTKERQRLITILNGLIDKNISKLRQMEQANKGDSQTYKEMQDVTERYKNQLSVIRQQQQAMQSSNKGFFRDIASGWKDAAARIVNYTVVYRSLWGLIQGFKNGVKTIAELNKSFTDIQMVTGYTDEQITKLSGTYGKLAKEMGATINEVAEGATEWLRQGKSVEDTNKLLEQSLIFSKVGAMSSAEATEYLTSTLNGYKMSVEDASHVVDVFSKLDMEAATSSKELAIAFSRTANSAHDAGIPFEQLAALITTVSETTRKSASSIGESFKTLAARYTNVKLGKFYDDNTDEPINDVEKTLSKLGVSIRTSENEWKSMGEVINEVGKNWKNYDQLQQNAIVTALAGVRQAENLRAAFNNFDKVLGYNESAYEAAGSSAQKYEVYLDSIEAKQNQLTSTFQEIAYQPGFEKLYKVILDLGIGFGNFLNTLLRTPAAIAPIAAGLAMLVKPTIVGGFTGMANSMYNYGVALQKVSVVAATTSGQMTRVGFAIQGLSNSQKIAILTTQNLTQAEINHALILSGMTPELAAETTATIMNAKAKDVATLSTIKWGVALKGLRATLLASPLFWMVAAGGIIFAAIKIFDALTTTTEENREALADLNGELTELSSNISSLEGELSTVQKRIEELKNSTPLNLTDKTELANLERQNAVLESQIALEKEKQKLKQQEVANAAEKALTDKTERAKTGETKVFRHGSYTSQPTEIETDVDRITALESKANEYVETMQKVQDSISKGNKSTADSFAQIAENLKSDISNSSSDIMEDLQSLYNGDSGQQMLADEIQKRLQSSLGKVGINITIAPSFSFAEQANQQLDKLMEQFQDYDINVPIRMIPQVKDIQVPFEKFANELKNLNNQLINSEINVEDYSKTIQRYIDSVNFEKLGEEGENIADGLQAVFATMTQGVVGAFDNIINTYDTGKTSGLEFIEQIMTAGDSIDSLGNALDEMADKDAFGELGDSATEAINKFEEAQDVLEDFNGFLDTVSKNSEYLNDNLSDTGEVAFDSADVGTKAYKQFTNSLHEDIVNLHNSNLDLFNELVQNLDNQGIKLDENLSNAEALLSENMLNDFNNTNNVANALVSVLGQKVDDFTSAASDVFDSLGKLINNFEYELSVEPAGYQTIGIGPLSFDMPTGIKIKGKSTGDTTANVNSLFNSAKKLVGASGDYLKINNMQDLLKPAGASPARNNNGVGDTGNPDGFISEKGDSGSSKKGTKEKEEDVMKDYNSRIKELEYLIKMSEYNQNIREIGSKEWTNELEKQLDLNKQIQEEAHKQAEYLRGRSDRFSKNDKGETVDKYSEELAELGSRWWEAEEDIKNLEVSRIEDIYDYQKGLIENNKDLSSTIMDSVIEGSEQWIDESKKQIKYNEELKKLELDRIDNYKKLGESLYRNEINDGYKNLIDLQKESLELAEKERDVLESLPNIIKDIIEFEKIEPLKKQKEILEGIKNLNSSIFDLEKNKAQALLGNNDALAKQFQDQIDYIKEQKEELDNITDLDEKRAKLRDIQLNVQKMHIEQLKTELALLQDQRTIRVYHEDKGWVWESDQSKVLEKQQEIADETADVQIGAIDNEIESWNDYIQKYEDVVTSVKIGQDKKLLATQLGANAVEQILNKETTTVETFADKMAEAYKKVIQETERLIAINEELASSGNVSGGSSGGHSSGSGGGGSSSSGNKGNGTAHIPGIVDVRVNIKDGKTQETGLPSGTVIKPDDSKDSWTIKGGTGGNYTGDKNSSSKKSTKKHDGIKSGLLGDVPIDPQKEIFVKALKGEGVFTQEQMNNGARVLKDLSLSALSNNNLQPNINNSNDETNIVRINNMNVYTNDANDFMKQMKNIVAVTGKQ